MFLIVEVDDDGHVDHKEDIKMLMARWQWSGACR